MIPPPAAPPTDSSVSSGTPAASTPSSSPAPAGSPAAKTPAGSAQAAAPTATPTATAFYSEVERIAYTVSENGKSILYSMNTDGTDVVRHTPSGANAWYPVWSPGGKQLAFFSDLAGDIHLYVMKKSDSKVWLDEKNELQGATQLTFYSDMVLPKTRLQQPPVTWSPRSDQLSYLYNGQVKMVDLEKMSQTSLALLDANYTAVALDWAPRRDTKYVAFLVKQGERFFSIWLVNPRLHDQTQLVSVHNSIIGPMAWNPDASKVTYTTDNKNVYEVSYETLKAKLLVLDIPEIGPYIAYAPVDGGSLLLLAKKEKGDAQYRVALIDKPAATEQEKGSLKYLTEAGVEYAAWSPDGGKILYVQNGELWSMASAGTGKKRLSLSGVQFPTWSKK